MENLRFKLHGVILPTPLSCKNLRGRDKNTVLSQHARTALFRSAELSGVALGPLEKGERGNPIPSGGSYWTVSHTSDFVAAVVAPFAIGIDIEKIGPCTPVLQAKLAAPEEWALAADIDPVIFCRYWTAKEAVLKATGVGMAGLPLCSVVRIADEQQIQLRYESKLWEVSHCFSAANHIASITVPAQGVEWHFRNARKHS